METLKNKREFDPIYLRGSKIYTKYTIIFIKNIKIQKFGFVTSKKVGNAVKRNRLRRIFREIVRNNIENFDSNNAYIIVAKKNCGEDFKNLNYNILKKDILMGLKKNEKNTNKNNKNIPENIK
ncbi:ribonuclease P protein component [Oceanivirga salmonicida]|uniref:ribonuclease P protein component n=1 Tax=Oceanivirga salmonicida TaxID=1769291 RepID=UPI000834B232|nr:ribonuclease P protein component [Oceanivirga salmonicida]